MRFNGRDCNSFGCYPCGRGSKRILYPMKAGFGPRLQSGARPVLQTVGRKAPDDVFRVSVLAERPIRVRKFLSAQYSCCSMTSLQSSSHDAAEVAGCGLIGSVTVLQSLRKYNQSRHFIGPFISKPICKTCK